MAGSWKKKIIYFFGGVMILIFVILFLLLNYGYSIGSRSGRLVKLSQKGFVLKEWEGTLNLGIGSHLTWEFSVYDDSLGRELKDHIGEVITLDYKEHLYRYIYSTNYEVTNFRLTQEVSRAKICPFLYLLYDDQEVFKKAAELIKLKRKDLQPEVDQCLSRPFK